MRLDILQRLAQFEADGKTISHDVVDAWLAQALASDHVRLLGSVAGGSVLSYAGGQIKTAGGMVVGLPKIASYTADYAISWLHRLSPELKNMVNKNASSLGRDAPLLDYEHRAEPDRLGQESSSKESSLNDKKLSDKNREQIRSDLRDLDRRYHYLRDDLYYRERQLDDLRREARFYH
ncbi:MAG: hypothetical protein ACU83U_14490 [Gammaproteobacteria bacterium]